MAIQPIKKQGIKSLFYTKTPGHAPGTKKTKEQKINLP